MAAPVDAARTATNIITAATSHAINVGSPVAGELLLVYVRFAGAAGTVTFTGYTQLALDTSDASDDENYLFYRWADGSEGTTDTLTCVSSQKLAAICWRITGAANPATTAPTVGGMTVGTAANINPGAVSPGSLDLSPGPGAFGKTVFGDGIGGSSEEQLAVGFVAGGTSLTSVAATLKKTGTPTDNEVVEIQSDSVGSPSGSVVGAVATVAGTSLTTSYAKTTWSGLSISVTQDATYWLVFRRSGTPSSVNHYQVATTDLGTLLSSVTTKARILGAWGEVSDRDITPTVVMQGAAADYLFLTVIGLDSETATATQPAGYSNLASANSGTGGAVATNCMIWGASKSTTGSSGDDPAAWTSSAPNAGVTAWTIAIPPPASVAAVAKPRRYAQSYGIAHRRAALR